MDKHKPLVIVTGKGGVGKSLVSAALAYKYAEQGLKTLLVEIGDDSFFAPFFACEVTYQAQPIKDNLFVSMWTWEQCLQEYINHFLPLAKLSKAFFSNRLIHSMINIAPGLSDLAILGKFTSGVRNKGPLFNFDRVILDSHATGHTLTLLRAPKALASAISFAPMGRQAEEISSCLLDSCQFVIACTCAEMPLVESEELYRKLEKEFSIHAHIVCNRTFPVKLGKVLRKESSMHSPHLEENGFYQYVESQLQQQKQAMSRLQELNSNLSCIPLITKEHESFKLLAKAASFL